MGFIGNLFSSPWDWLALFVLIALVVFTWHHVIASLGERLPRLTGTLLITLGLLVAVGLLAPQQLLVSLYKVSLICMAGMAGYWLDVAFFPYARPDSYLSNPDWRHAKPVTNDANCPVVMGYRLTFAAAMLRRAIVVGAAMLASALGA